MTNYRSPTIETHEGLDTAFRQFNTELFEDRLPEVIITLQRKRGVRGYYWSDQFVHRTMNDNMPEIAMNPEHMGRTVSEVLSTLVHEMVHHKQFTYGKPGKNGHHNAEWASMMDEVGLTPTSTGAEGGSRTGRKVTHMIVPGGAFDLSCQRLLASGFDLPWFTNPPAPKEKKSDPSKVKHTCPDCQQNVWGKAGIRVVCADCEQMMEPAQ